jgi:dihydroflavonol-4-reductase
MTIRDTTKIAQELFPALKIGLPVSVPKPILYGIARLMELTSKITGTAPRLTVKDLSMFSGLQQDFDTTKAKIELGFAPGPAVEAVKEAMLYLKDNAHRFNIRSFYTTTA